MKKALKFFVCIATIFTATVILYAANANDDFTDVNGTALTSHTPSGSGAAGTWNLLIAGGTAQIQSNHVEEINNGNGNRFRNTADLGFDEMDVQADFTQVTGTPFVGVMGRIPSVANSTAYECQYDFTTGQVSLSDGTNSNTGTIAWPGNPATIKLVLRAGNVQCQLNGTTRASLTSNLFTGNTRAGIILGNFDGFSPEINADNYQSTGVSGGGGPTLKPLPLLGVGDEFTQRIR